MVRPRCPAAAAKAAAAASAAAAAHVSVVQDEPFHVPMARHYCAGNLTAWDPKITTFPGLYVIGAAYAHASAALLRWAGATLVRRSLLAARACHSRLY